MPVPSSIDVEQNSSEGRPVGSSHHAFRLAQRQSKLPAGNQATLQHGHIPTVPYVWDGLGSHRWGVPPRGRACPWHLLGCHRPAALLSHIPSRTSASPLLPARDGNQGNEREAAKVKGSPGPPERGRAGG